MNSYDKALQKVKLAQSKINNYNICTVVGPTGPAGPALNILGSFATLDELIENNPTGRPGNAYMVGSNLYVWANNNWLDVGEIKGPQGEMGETGPQGERGLQGEIGPQGIQGAQGEVGPTGPEGKMGPQGLPGADGTSVTILGSFASEEELRREHATGSPGQSYLVGENLYVWSAENDDWTNVGQIKGPKGDIGPTGEMGPQGLQGPPGPKGEEGPQGVPGERGPQGIQGPKGDTGQEGPMGPQGLQGIPGPLSIPVGYFFTSIESITSSSEDVGPMDPIPIDVQVLDTDGNFYHNKTNNSITFLKSGTYYINYTVQAKSTGNYIATGFYENGVDTIYAGNAVWSDGTKPVLINGQGIINVTIPVIYQLVNLSKSTISIQSPELTNLSTESSFASPLVSIVIFKIK